MSREEGVVADSFFDQGLCFECTRCSCCCRVTPGYVFLTETDLLNLLKATGIPRSSFLEEYCRVVSINGFKRLSLMEKKNLDCIFWEDDGCTVYAHRPLQCRSFPFWSTHLDSEEAWNKLKDYCPGVGRGKRFSRSEIEDWLARKARGRFL